MTYPYRTDTKPRAVWPAHLEHLTMHTDRLEYLRGELRAERISTGELAELQSLAPHIPAGDVELLEAAGVPEFPEPTYTWHSGSGRICITFANLDQCRQCAHPGPCDLDVADLSTDPAIAAQLAAIDAADLARELKDYGAWDETELADHAQNLQRVLWLAACDVHETPADHLDGVTA